MSVRDLVAVEDPRAALEAYRRAVRESRAAAIDARARIERAAAALDAARHAVADRRRRAEKLAEKRGRRSS